MRWDQGQTDSSFNCFNFFHVSSLKFPPGIISTTTPLFCCSFCLEWFTFAFVTACLSQGLNLSPSVSLRINVLCHRRGIEGKRLFGKVPSLPFLMCERTILITSGRKKIFPTHTVKPRKLLLILRKFICKLFCFCFSPASTLRALPAQEQLLHPDT